MRSKCVAVTGGRRSTRLLYLPELKRDSGSVAETADRYRQRGNGSAGTVRPPERQTSRARGMVLTAAARCCVPDRLLMEETGIPVG